MELKGPRARELSCPPFAIAVGCAPMRLPVLPASQLPEPVSPASTGGGLFTVPPSIPYTAFTCLLKGKGGESVASIVLVL
jgi:hypothetical protein